MLICFHIFFKAGMTFFYENRQRAQKVPLTEEACLP